MIFDCFTFFNELDLLEIRLNELNTVVDRFVLVEAEFTHNGDKKPLYYEENKDRFGKFAHKIVHVVVSAEDFSPALNGETFQERAWMRENIQRNAIAKGLSDATDNDVVIVSDLDEMPRKEKVREAALSLHDGEVVGFVLNAYNFYANLRNVSDPFWGNDPRMATIRTFKDEAAYSTSRYSHFVLPAVNQRETATRFRYIKPTNRIPDAGWHFSYLGGARAAFAKVQAFNEMGLYSRKDLAEYIERRILRGQALWGRDRFLPEPLDEKFPAYVREHRDRFAHLIVQDVPPQGLKSRFLWKWFYFTACVRRFAMRIAFVLTPKWVRAIIKRVVGVQT